MQISEEYRRELGAPAKGVRGVINHIVLKPQFDPADIKRKNSKRPSSALAECRTPIRIPSMPTQRGDPQGQPFVMGPERGVYEDVPMLVPPFLPPRVTKVRRPNVVIREG